MTFSRVFNAAERVRWTDDEDDFILTHDSLKSGVHDWESIANELSERAATKGQPGRTPDAVRNHWHRLIKSRGPFKFDEYDAETAQPVVRPRVDRQKWSKAEDEIILLGVEELGRSWRQIAKRLPPCADTGKMRSDSSVRNRWQRLVNKETDANDPPSGIPSPVQSESLPETLAEAQPTIATEPSPLFALPPSSDYPTFGAPLTSVPPPAMEPPPARAPAREFTRAQGRARYDMFDHPERSYRERSWRCSDIDVDDDLSVGLQTSLAVGAPAPDTAMPAPAPPFLSKKASSVDAESFATGVFAASPAAAPAGESGSQLFELDELLSIVGTLTPTDSNSSIGNGIVNSMPMATASTPLFGTPVQCP